MNRRSRFVIAVGDNSAMWLYSRRWPRRTIAARTYVRLRYRGRGSTQASPTSQPEQMRRDNYAVLVNEFVPTPWTHLFNTSQFFEIHRTPNACYLQLVAKASSDVLATIH